MFSSLFGKSTPSSSAPETATAASTTTTTTTTTSTTSPAAAAEAALPTTAAQIADLPGSASSLPAPPSSPSPPPSRGASSPASTATAAAEAAAATAAKEEAPHGSLMAVEALNLATLNVVSFFVMLTGGVSWALDLSSLDDVRRRAQFYMRGTPLDGSGGPSKPGMSDEEAEREVEEWMARVLARKDVRLLGSGGGKTKASEDAEGKK
ncbi:hypothetical protein SPI_03973 [Niveomyces insectorum RCEF 264]|uniref:Altered inheritance of mitochondria protein 11 n=1 Tax=Niveomyces insectorum RCEF 264 TaxID=1081102 RepID=A0A167VBI3_9HYPO|nr:hypothetical protein SPI_03973 [Niveomyces insectorum RCEF 264]